MIDQPVLPEEPPKTLKIWRDRAFQAEKLHEDWERTFECKRLHSMFVGTGQWEPDEDPDGDKYYVNLFFAGVETRKPSLVFRSPRVVVKPRPARTDDPYSLSEYRAKLYEDTLNTLLSDKRVGFLDGTMLALQEAFFRIGVVEVGITGDVVDNPRAGKPVLKEDGTEVMDQSEPVLEGDYSVASELPFCRRIPAEQFLVSTSNKNDILANDWVGYYEFVRKEDIEANRAYAKVPDLSSTSTEKSGTTSGYVDTTVGIKKPELVKLYKIWDLRAKVRHVFSDTGEGFLIEGEPYKCLPLAILKFHEILDSFYPLPPTYNWIPPQRNSNDERETIRIHRKRFKRRYTVLDGKVDQQQLDELEVGEDGTMVKVPNHDVIKPIEDAQMNSTSFGSLGITKDDFTNVSGIGGEARQVAESETATQANLIATQSEIRERFMREQVARFLADAAFKLLYILNEKASLPFWIYTNVDVASPMASMEALQIAMAWQQVRPDQYEDILNWDIAVDMESMSAVVEDRQRQNWLQVMQMISSPQISPYLMASDVLLRKTLNYFGVTNEKEILEIKSGMQKVMTFQMNMGLMQAMGMPLMPPFDPSSKGKPSPGVQGVPGLGPGPTPTNEETQGQLRRQM